MFNMPYLCTTAILYVHFGVRELAKFKWWASAVVNTIFVVKIILQLVQLVIDCKANYLSLRETLVQEISGSWQVREICLLCQWVKI